MSETEELLVERLLDEFVERLRRGETPSIAEYESRHPQCAAEIRELFSAAQMMERRAQRRPQDGHCEGSPAKAAERLGDFRILREIGRGGMGIVYEAEQQSLGRRVAIKVLPQSSLLTPKSLRRFEREARIAARLHHSNIIPVFGVGEDQGLHYIVMQLIRGVGLDRIVRRLTHDGPGETASAPPDDAVSGDDGAAMARALLRGEFSRARPSATSSGITHALSTGPSSDGGADSRQAEPPSHHSAPVPAESSQTPGPRYWESVARIGLQAADALSYAHGHGTLHRDIKPANLLIDFQGVVWIGDFGLAHAEEHNEASQTADLAGTLRYMAPERFHGEADARSDIYSLGLTLYELLALRLAYDDASPSVLIRKISEGHAIRPRTINPAIPRDLETIVLKAIAGDPAHRYASAAELAEDLELFLDDRPIRARRIGVAERLYRWSRRNRTVACLLGLTAVLLILVAVVTSVGYVQTRIAHGKVRHALAGESEQRKAAQIQQHKAEALSALTMAALDEIFDQFVPNSVAMDSAASPYGSMEEAADVPLQPVVSKEVAATLERMLAFYDRLAEQETDDSQVRRKIADANRRVGDIRRRLGNVDQSRAAYLRAIERYEQLQQDAPGDAMISVEIARIYNELGSLNWMARWKGEGRSYHRKAMEVLGSVPAGAEESVRHRYELARTLYLLGRGGPPDVVPGKQPPGPARRSPPPKPEADRRGPADEGPAGDPKPPPLAVTVQENRDYLHRAIQSAEALAVEYPASPEYRHLLACCYRDLPPAAPEPAAPPDQDPQSKAIDILAKLVADFPAVPDYRHDLSKAYSRIDPHELQQSGGSFAQAEVRLRRAIEVLEHLIAEHPNAPDYAASQVQTLYTLSEVQRRARQPSDAEATLRRALARQSALAEQFPQVSPYKAWKAILQESLAKLLANRGQISEARGILEGAIVSLEELLKSDPNASYARNLLGRCCTSLADVLVRLGEDRQAAEVLRRGRGHRND